jgi:hypothetical protein
MRVKDRSPRIYDIRVAVGLGSIELSISSRLSIGEARVPHMHRCPCGSMSSTWTTLTS